MDTDPQIIISHKTYKPNNQYVSDRLNHIFIGCNITIIRVDLKTDPREIIVNVDGHKLSSRWSKDFEDVLSKTTGSAMSLSKQKAIDIAIEHIQKQIDI
jgi:hypothetical protein